MERYHDRIRLDPSLRVGDAFQYLQGAALSHFCFAAQNATAPATWENFREFILERFSCQGVGETIRRLYGLRWKGSLERLAAEFSAVLSQGVPPPQSQLIPIFLSRIPLHMVRELDTANFATWTEAKEALRRALSPKEHLTEQWLANAPADLPRAAAATPNLLPADWRRRHGSIGIDPRPKKFERESKYNCLLMRACDDSSTDNCALYDGSREIVTSQQERSHSNTTDRTKFRRGTAALTKQRCAAEVLPCDKAHSQDGKHELAANPQAAPPRRVPSASAAKSELEQPHEFVTQLKVDAVDCSSAQFPSDQGMHLNITQQTRGSGCFNLSVVKVTAADLQERLGQTESDTVREEGKAAHADLLDSVNQLGLQAPALVRKQPKRCKNFKSKSKRVPIDELVAAARTAGADLPIEQPDCSLIAAAPLHVQQPVADTADEGTRTSESSQSLPGSTRASHKQHKVEELLASAPQQGVHPQVVQLVDKYRDLFLDALPDGLPPQRAFDMTIVTVRNATVPKGGTPRFTQPEVSAIRTILQEYLRKKWIQSSRSPYAAPVILVPKNDDPPGSPGSRLVISYRPLDAVTIAPKVPLPVIEDVLASLQFAKWFTALDMEQGFHQVRMAPEDRHKTAFRTSMGQFEWRVMRFGLKGARSTFQPIMNSIFFDMMGQGVLIYMDDVLVYAATFDEHLRLLDSVLARLLQHKMYPKLAKCKFAARSIEYLGYRVGADGIHPSTEKVSAIPANRTRK
ncbi:hypothetical protein Emed_001772 [Eimeria media]